MDRNATRTALESGKTVLGVELGSTRIKAALIDQDHRPIASGSYAWENRYDNGVWTYDIGDMWTGLQQCYRTLRSDVLEKYDVHLEAIGALGFSAMMHGYLALDAQGRLLVPFRTWRNTTTAEAAEQLTALFHFTVPLRWSIAHLYQAILNKEPHVKDIRYLTTLAGYVHWTLTGHKVLGVGDASGMFPIDSTTGRFHTRMMDLFNERIQADALPWTLQQIMPAVLVAGNEAGALTADGTRLIDPSGRLRPGAPLCPPEGDAGTGMVATNSVAPRTGNVSAGTSVFAMIVLDHALSALYPEIDMVTTPSGAPVAMVHCNNCTSDLDAWVALFQEVAAVLDVEVSQARLFDVLYRQALLGDADGGGLLAYNYISGEPITQLPQGRPLFVRTPESRFTLANFMRTHLFSALGALKIGMDILVEQEHVTLEQVLGHGGFFKTTEAAQKVMAAALNVPVSVMETAGEGGAWGIALLAAYLLHKGPDEPLDAYLSTTVFAGEKSVTVAPQVEDVAGFTAFMDRYKRGLVIERAAVTALA